MSHFTSWMDLFHRIELKTNRSDYSDSRSIDHEVCLTSQRLTAFSCDVNPNQHNLKVYMSASTDKSFMKQQKKTHPKRENESISATALLHLQHSSSLLLQQSLFSLWFPILPHITQCWKKLPPSFTTAPQTRDNSSCSLKRQSQNYNYEIVRERKRKGFPREGGYPPKWDLNWTVSKNN